VYVKHTGAQTDGGTCEGWDAYFPLAAPVLCTKASVPFLVLAKAETERIIATAVIAQSVFFTGVPPDFLLTDVFLLRVVVRQFSASRLFKEIANALGTNPTPNENKVKRKSTLGAGFYCFKLFKQKMLQVSSHLRERRTYAQAKIR
jgi:hypothetical protein